jgi:hypothetical protein
MRQQVFLTFAALACLASRGAQACEPVPGYHPRLNNGVYCLASDIEVSDGYTGIIIDDDVVLDCGGHRITNLGYSANGIGVYGSNVVVRNCVVEGFSTDIMLSPATRYFRIMGNTILSPGSVGISAGDEGAIMGNVFYSAGADGGPRWFINAGTADIQDNLIVNGAAQPTAEYGARYGISTFSNNGGVVARNVIRNVVPAYGSQGVAIHAGAGYPVIYRNVMSAPPGRGDAGMYCHDGAALSLLNTVVGYPHEEGSCTD